MDTLTTRQHSPLALLLLSGSCLCVLSACADVEETSEGEDVHLVDRDGSSDTKSDTPVVQEPDVPTGTARFDMTHLAAGLGTVDVWADGELWIDDLDTFEMVHQMALPSGVSVTLSVTPSDALSANEALATFKTGESVNPEDHIILAVTGATSESGGSETRGDMLRVEMITSRVPDVDDDHASILAFHSAQHLSPVDFVFDNGFAHSADVSELGFGTFSTDVNGVAAYVSFDTDESMFSDFLVFDVNIADTDNHLNAFQIDHLTERAGHAMLLALVSTVGNKGLSARAFDLSAPAGTRTQSESLKKAARLQVIHNAAPARMDGVTLTWDGLPVLSEMPFQSATPYATFPSDEIHHLSIRARQDLLTKASEISFEPGSRHIGVITPSQTDDSVELRFAHGQEALIDPDIIPVKFYHGALGHNAVGISMEGNALVDRLEYGSLDGDYVPMNVEIKGRFEIVDADRGGAMIARVMQETDMFMFSSPAVIMTSGSRADSLIDKTRSLHMMVITPDGIVSVMDVEVP